jgi:hypothetical protein
MKKKILLIIGYVFIQKISFGQIDESKSYLYLFSDSVVYGNIIVDENSFSGTKHFSVNSKVIEPNLVKFYKDEIGFYANIKYLKFSGSSRFAERIRQGRINLYKKEAANYKSILYNVLLGWPDRMIISANESYYYYNKNFDNLKKISYKNLNSDLSDNPESMKHLNKYKSITHIQTAINIVGGISLIAGYVGLLDNLSSNGNKKPTVAITGLLMGTVCIFTNYFLILSKRKHLINAIVIY